MNRDAMSLVEDDAGRPEIDLEPVDLTLLHKHFALEAFAEPRPQNRVEHEPLSAVGINVNQLGCKISVTRIAFGPQFNCNASGDLYW
jgi:hypothetical protein